MRVIGFIKVKVSSLNPINLINLINLINPYKPSFINPF